MTSKYLVLLLSTLLFGQCIAENEPTKNQGDRSELKKSIAKECAGSSYSIKCLKLDIVSWVDKLDETVEYSVLPGIAVVRENVSESANNAEIIKELAREFPNDPDARLDAYLMNRITGYFDSHSVKLGLWGSNSLGEARGKKGGGGGGGGGMQSLMAAGVMMKATLMAIALKGVALIASKALMTGLIALMLSTIIGLKSLSYGGGDHTTHEVVAKPIYIHEGHGGGGHHDRHSMYRRSLNVQLPLALQPGYRPGQ